MSKYSREATVIAAVFANLRSQHLAVDTVEEQLVVEALRRTNNDLCDASLADLADYLRQLDDSQLRGLANNVKGIYHELLYIDQFNSTHSRLTAAVYPDTNHPGSDVFIRETDTGEVFQELQLKASDSHAYLMEHALRYPDIDLLATTEVAAQYDGVDTSGLSNAQLDSDVASQLDQLPDLFIAGQLLHGAETSALVSGGLRAIEILQGKAAPSEALRKSVADIAIATGTSAFVAFLFS